MKEDIIVKEESFPVRFADKLLMGMPLSEYARTLITPFNIVAVVIM